MDKRDGTIAIVPYRGCNNTGEDKRERNDIINLIASGYALFLVITADYNKSMFFVFIAVFLKMTLLQVFFCSF